jgi:hypothetical protein
MSVYTLTVDWYSGVIGLTFVPIAVTLAWTLAELFEY